MVLLSECVSSVFVRTAVLHFVILFLERFGARLLSNTEACGLQTLLACVHVLSNSSSFPHHQLASFIDHSYSNTTLSANTTTLVSAIVGKHNFTHFGTIITFRFLFCAFQHKHMPAFYTVSTRLSVLLAHFKARIHKLSYVKS